MAQRMQVIFEDDIDGSEAEGTVTFALNGVGYELDLSAKNRNKLLKASGRTPRPRARSAPGLPRTVRLTCGQAATSRRFVNGLAPRT
jgi:hypothetical protein